MLEMIRKSGRSTFLVTNRYVAGGAFSFYNFRLLETCVMTYFCNVSSLVSPKTNPSFKTKVFHRDAFYVFELLVTIYLLFRQVLIHAVCGTTPMLS